MDRDRHILISVSPGTELDHKDSVQSVDLRLLKLSSLRDLKETAESSPPQKSCTQADHTGTGMVVCCLSGVRWTELTLWRERLRSTWWQQPQQLPNICMNDTADSPVCRC